MRLKFIDSLRGLAAFLVLVQHLANHYLNDPSTTSSWRRAIEVLFVDSVDFGRLGVVLFFLISGFVIPYSLHGDNALQKFAISRVFRLYPAYWIGLLAVLVVDVLFLNQTYTVGNLFKNMTMVPKLFGGAEMSGVYWTLFIEIVFYFLCAGLFFFNLLNSSKLIMLIVVVFSLLGSWVLLFNKVTGFHLPVQYLSLHLSFLFSGFLLRKVILDKEKIKMQVFLILCFQLLSVAIVSGVIFDVKVGVFSPYDGIGVLNSYIIAIMLFVFVIIKRTEIHSVLLWLGRGSYSMYLLHTPVCVLIIYGLGSSLSVFWVLLLSVILSLLVAELSFRFVEIPFQRIGKMFLVSGRSTDEINATR